eukprot:TRINITY_DN20846_c0_g1_i2.p1 TRINITY_DN20846_c0_g1~~TRINITY_DN20846_c0_g1_i2.p1  ORF type:complete len:137 (+),score=16.33 TRINITY_DN20846_c0_g1_i2:166-576(+)
MACPAKSPPSATANVSFPRSSTDDLLNDTVTSYVYAKPGTASSNATRSPSVGPQPRLLRQQTVSQPQLWQTIPQYSQAGAALSSPACVAELVAKYETATCTPVLQHHVEQVKIVPRPQVLPAGLLLPNASGSRLRG